MRVCVCVHKAAVPEGSRQSKGVNSSLMVGIQQSPVVKSADSPGSDDRTAVLNDLADLDSPFFGIHFVYYL